LLLIAELLVGVVPVTAFYVCLFPAGAFWARSVLGLVSRNILNSFTISMAAVFVLGGIGLVSIWWVVLRRLLGRAVRGPLPLAGVLAGVAASIMLLIVVTIVGAFWIDYYLYGTPLLVAAHQIFFMVRSTGARPATRPSLPGV
jgi:hypothetical protein